MKVELVEIYKEKSQNKKFVGTAHIYVCDYILAEYGEDCYNSYVRGLNNINSILDEILISCFFNKENIPNTAKIIVENYRELSRKSKRK